MVFDSATVLSEGEIRVLAGAEDRIDVAGPQIQQSTAVRSPSGPDMLRTSQ